MSNGDVEEQGLSEDLQENTDADTSKSDEKEESATVENGSEQISESQGESEQQTQNKKISHELLSAIFRSLSTDAPEGASRDTNEITRLCLNQILTQHPVSEEYNILIIHDDIRMIRDDADNIYSAATKFQENKPLLLILYSSGGDIGSAYLISKLCRECTSEKFVVVIPRKAKSAATLICCGADEIHMGSLSELGPIDPQINDLPVLGLKNTMEHIADLIRTHPHASEMFAKYLHLSLEPIHLGYHERVAESAVQYAERLLEARRANSTSSVQKIANDLVYSYKDHRFVIDKTEAIKIFGEEIIHTNTPEYSLGNSIYETMILITKCSDMMNHHFYFIGSCNSNPQFLKKSR